MKVYGTNAFRDSHQVRVIFAGTKKQFADALGCSMYYITGWAGETKTDQELRVALSKPNTLFYRGLDDIQEPYIEWSRR